MPTRALHMRKIRELIRLKYEARLSHEQIAGALAISKGVVAKYVARIERTGLEPGALMAMSDAEVMARIAPAPRPASYGGRIKPDFAHLHAELKRPNVTLMLLWQEYSAANAGGLTYHYSQFADLYRNYVATLRRSMRQVHRAGEARAHHAYLFVNKRANRMKVFVHDGFGLWLCARRLYEGSFIRVGARHDRGMPLTHEQLQAIVVGLPWERLDERAKIRVL